MTLAKRYSRVSKGKGVLLFSGIPEKALARQSYFHKEAFNGD